MDEFDNHFLIMGIFYKQHAHFNLKYYSNFLFAFLKKN